MAKNRPSLNLYGGNNLIDAKFENCSHDVCKAKLDNIVLGCVRCKMPITNNENYVCQENTTLGILEENKYVTYNLYLRINIPTVYVMRGTGL